MSENIVIRLVLMPFSLLYGIIIGIRNFLYRVKLLKSVRFDLPVIAVGNLSVGGAGKTPHIEYLIQLLDPYLQVATLSRGYGRTTRGFVLVNAQHQAIEVGDEPLQYRRKYPDIWVGVAENRALGIPRLISTNPDLQVILLDDAFQHLAVQPGLNILLTEYAHPFTKDFLMPAGRLRDWRSAYQRADIIIVTKCPNTVNLSEKEAFINDIQPFPHQSIYFSRYIYNDPYYMFNNIWLVPLQAHWDVLLIAGIARTDYLVKYLVEKVKKVDVLEFRDHHIYTKENMAFLKKTFDAIENPNKIILTTEKDAVRLEPHAEFLLNSQMPICILPVQVSFLDGEGAIFDAQIKDFLLTFKV
jgi:tetraacyldisaccharide 4'-kinase